MQLKVYLGPDISDYDEVGGNGIKDWNKIK